MMTAVDVPSLEKILAESDCPIDVVLQEFGRMCIMFPAYSAFDLGSECECESLLGIHGRFQGTWQYLPMLGWWQAECGSESL